MHLYFNTNKGKLFLGNSCESLKNYHIRKYIGKVNLIITSPPFALLRKKKYGNKIGEEYKDWFKQFVPVFNELLAPNGSLVIEFGNTWEKNRPVQSVIHHECLFELLQPNYSDLRLIQEFIIYNPAKLPTPAKWVTVERIRLVDSFNYAWWLSKTDFPKCDNIKITKFYEDINQDIKKVLPYNVISSINTTSNSSFLRNCKKNNIQPHPARMNEKVINYFINFLTEKNDLVFDPFGGSNTTGFCAESLDRRWLTIEINEDYAKQSLLRFM